MAALDVNEKESALFNKPVKIGDVTMEQSVGSEGLKALINAQLRELAPLLRDENFVFKFMEVQKNEK